MGVRRAFGDGGITTGGRACCAASVAAALVGRTGAEGLPLHGVGSPGPPRSGDLSHPGFVECSSNHGLVSWHASHRSASHETGPDGKPITAIDRADLVCH